MIKLIGLAGKRGSGKGAVCDILQYKCGYHHVDVEVLNFADALKSICSSLEDVENPSENLSHYYTQEGKADSAGIFGLTRGELLQQVGQALRDWKSTVWVDVTMKAVNALLAVSDENQLVVVADVRYPDEADAIRAAGGVVVNIVGDPMGQRGDGTRDDNHPSEVALDDYKHFDYTIANNGTLDDLKEAVGRLLTYAHTLPGDYAYITANGGTDVPNTHA